jgi:hypothetical protein
MLDAPDIGHEASYFLFEEKIGKRRKVSDAEMMLILLAGSGYPGFRQRQLHVISLLKYVSPSLFL